MAHARKLLRAKVVELLVAGATAAADRVQATRELPIKRIGLPAIAVYTLDEDVDTGETAPREYTRMVTLVIEGWVAATAAVEPDDAMDDLAEQIEDAMAADRYLGGTAAESRLTGTITDVVADGDRLLGLIVITYAVTYRTEPELPADGSVTDFLRADVIHNIGGAVADRAHDQFDLEDTP